jgi:DNA-binding transcriptional MerR regulator
MKAEEKFLTAGGLSMNKQSATDGISLQELSERSGMEPRTIRSWVAEGILPGPETPGRNATYPLVALDRLLAAVMLRRGGASLPEIRHELAALDPGQIQILAEQSAEMPIRSGPSSAADYLRQNAAAFSESRHSVEELSVAMCNSEPFRASEPDPADRSIEIAERLAHSLGGSLDRRDLGQAIALLEQAFGGRLTIPSKARARDVVRISINPAVTLEVEGPLSSAQRRNYERVADIVREYLTGSGP